MRSHWAVKAATLSVEKVTGDFDQRMTWSDLLLYRIILAIVAQGIECQAVNQRVCGLIPRQGPCLGCGSGPQLGARRRLLHISLFLPPCPFSESK